MKKFLIGLLIRLIDSSLVVDYKKIDKKAVEEWCFHSFDSVGWRSYFAYEDLKIMKEMTFGKDRDSYLMLVGRRLQLLYMFNEMRKVVENRKSVEEKKASAAKKSGE